MKGVRIALACALVPVLAAACSTPRPAQGPAAPTPTASLPSSPSLGARLERSAEGLLVGACVGGPVGGLPGAAVGAALFGMYGLVTGRPVLPEPDAPAGRARTAEKPDDTLAREIDQEIEQEETSQSAEDAPGGASQPGVEADRHR